MSIGYVWPYTDIYFRTHPTFIENIFLHRIHPFSKSIGFYRSMSTFPGTWYIYIKVYSTCSSPTCGVKPWKTHELLVASYFRAVTSTNLPSTWSSKIPTTSTLSSKDLVQMGHLNSSWSEACSSSSTTALRSTVGHWSHGRSWRNLPLIVPSFSQVLWRPLRSTAMAKNGKDGCNYQSLQVESSNC